MRADKARSNLTTDMRETPEEDDKVKDDESEKVFRDLPKWFDSKPFLTLLCVYVVAFFWAGMFEKEFTYHRAWIPHAVLAPGYLIMYYAFTLYVYRIFRNCWSGTENKLILLFISIPFTYPWICCTWLMIRGGIDLFREIFVRNP